MNWRDKKRHASLRSIPENDNANVSVVIIITRQIWMSSAYRAQKRYSVTSLEYDLHGFYVRLSNVNQS